MDVGIIINNSVAVNSFFTIETQVIGLKKKITHINDHGLAEGQTRWAAI